MLSINKNYIIFIFFAICGCKKESIEKLFFKQPPEKRLYTLEGYSLENQYKIFRYGNDKIEPPILNLADPISLRGGDAVPFLYDQLKNHTDILTTRDVLLIFETMSRDNTYNVKNNKKIMDLLELRIAEMNDPEWKAICFEMLERIKNRESTK